MDSGSVNVTGWILPVVIFSAGLVFGIVLEIVVQRWVRRFAERTKWEADEVIVSGLRGMALSWCSIAGLYAAIPRMPVSALLENYLFKAVLVLFVFSVSLAIAQVLAGLVRLYGRKVGGIPGRSSILANLTKLLIIIIGLLIILQSLGISVTPIITALGIGGLAVALALQDTLSNLFAGLHIVASKQIRPGDYVKLSSGEEGYVADITWRNTTIRSLANNIHVIPNSKLAQSIVTNYYLPDRELGIFVELRAGYTSDLEQVERIAIEVAREVMQTVPGAVAPFNPFVRYHTFDDSCIKFTVILRGREFVDQYLIKHEFVKRLHKRYAAEGITIPFPIQTVLLNDRGQGAH